MSATTLGLLIGALMVCVLLLAVGSYHVLERWQSRRVGRYEYVRKTFLTGNEVEFYHRLRRACGSDYVLMAQVSMAALVDTALKPEHPRYWEVRTLFSGRICDYVVCHPKTLAPLVVVELDDKMHDFGRDARRDTFLSQVGMPTMRFWSREKPSEQELRQKLHAILRV